ncbi:MAG: hypothetical protein J6K50_02525 [Clostridia bacterium]|nr:hypothetical protein [Clostridia bacterium]
MIYTIKNSALEISVDDTGAQLVGVNAYGKERLWQNETGEWAGHAPILFPVCGNTSMVVDGKRYPMPRHGLVRREKFALTECGEDCLTFSFSSNEETKRGYPFGFRFSQTYRIVGDELHIESRIRNLSDRPMPFSLGGHESFALSEEIGNYRLVFEREEEFVHHPHNDEGLLTGEQKYLGKGKTFWLDPAFFTDDKTVILSGVQSDRVLLCDKAQNPSAEISFGGFDNLLLWRPGAARMICIEPWLVLPDTDGKIAGEFGKREGVAAVAAGEERRIVRTIKYYR